jgi:hypothetical protein
MIASMHSIGQVSDRAITLGVDPAGPTIPHFAYDPSEHEARPKPGGFRHLQRASRVAPAAAQEIAQLCHTVAYNLAYATLAASGPELCSRFWTILKRQSEDSSCL